ncbi:MAG: hypothetical protein EOO03_09800 [Chitinophagaceae bacterium]|nr:MAG: hypothetical protein EOO03_09800 [Chitinophagaceae bacterium]
MKYSKISLAIVAVAVSGAIAFAQSNTSKPVASSTGLTPQYFELISGGNKMTRTHWVLSSNDPSCPTDLEEVPCRILAEPNGSNPSVAAFNDIIANSANFSAEYPEKVTYKP